MDKETITVRELMNFMINNYRTNIQNEKLSTALKNYLHWGDYHINRVKIKDEYCLKFEYSNFKFILCKKDNIFYILSRDLSLTEQNDLLDFFDFSKTYDYFIQDGINDTIKFKAYYVGKENNKYDLTIKYSYKSLTIGLEDYYFSYQFYQQDFRCEECVLTYDLNYMYYLKTIFSTDNDFLDHVIIDFSLLSNYIQKSYAETPEMFQYILEEHEIEVKISEILRQNLLPSNNKPESKILKLFSKKS